MALFQRQEMRQTQGQSLVMTPQLQQAIKLLQLSTLELAAFVEQHLEENPLLQRDDGTGEDAGAEPETPVAEVHAAPAADDLADLAEGLDDDVGHDGDVGGAHLPRYAHAHGTAG